MPQSRYNPDNKDLTRKTSLMEEVLNTMRDMLIKFIVSLPAPEQLIMSQEAQLVFTITLISAIYQDED